MTRGIDIVFFVPFCNLDRLCVHFAALYERALLRFHLLGLPEKRDRLQVRIAGLASSLRRSYRPLFLEPGGLLLRSDAFIAGMRAVCVVAGLLGTVVMPRMEKWIGLVRTGTWSLWLEFLPLTPALVSFYVGAVRHRPPWNSAMLFTGAYIFFWWLSSTRTCKCSIAKWYRPHQLYCAGLAVSRIGLWSFDLAQLAQLQMELNHHPRRNALTALQYALQNVFDLVSATFSP